MEDNQKFSAEQSLQVIQSMILKAKEDVVKNSFYFLLWGWLVIMVASVFVAYEWQLLMLALAVLLSYIIPGHMLSAKEKTQIN
ncbi:MAG TPA: hypothetical protein VFP97_02035 [Chitinophagaceae bacterium]|nr:hypothetical protein [Chitinophagaceae bacterium]